MIRATPVGQLQWQELHQWGSYNDKSYTSGAVAMARATPVVQLQ